jgi:hypothetical protein
MIMTLLIETISHNPWTKGEMYYDRKKMESEPRWQLRDFSPFQTFSLRSNAVEFGVSVCNDRFPNFKEEINV